MEKTLGYLRESLSNYIEKDKRARTIYEKLDSSFKTEREFADHLEQEEIQFLNEILPDEIDYAKEEKDEQRYNQLNDMFEQLY
jgi:uncharacterized protein YpiB (UPF0302 family)